MKVIFVFLIAVAALSSAGKAGRSDHRCKESTKDRCFNDPDCCNIFHLCDGVDMSRMKCPHGLEFNSQKQQCDWPSESDCGKNSDSSEEHRNCDDDSSSSSEESDSDDDNHNHSSDDSDSDSDDHDHHSSDESDSDSDDHDHHSSDDSDSDDHHHYDSNDSDN